MEGEVLASVECWADLVRDAAPFKPLQRRADPEEDLVDLEAFLLAQERAARGAEDPVTEEEVLASVEFWADLVRDAAPFKPLQRRADPEEDLVDLEAFLLAQERAARGAEDPVTEEE